MTQKPEVSILIPHYKTLELTKLCLRLLRKNSALGRIKTIVVDNDSQDESSEYLKTVNWIHLIHRPKVEGESGTVAHGNALDLAMQSVDTEQADDQGHSVTDTSCARCPCRDTFLQHSTCSTDLRHKHK